MHDVYARVYNARETMFSDQTGQFPTRSKRGNKYIMVMVEVDSNAILVEPLKSRKDTELIRGYKSLLLTSRNSASETRVGQQNLQSNERAHLR